MRPCMQGWTRLKLCATSRRQASCKCTASVSCWHSVHADLRQSDALLMMVALEAPQKPCCGLGTCRLMRLQQDWRSSSAAMCDPVLHQGACLPPASILLTRPGAACLNSLVVSAMLTGMCSNCLILMMLSSSQDCLVSGVTPDICQPGTECIAPYQR